MKSYEAICVFNPQVEETRIDALLEKLSGRIKSSQGEIEAIEKWGKRRLTYRFLKHKDLKEGFYVLVKFKAEAGAVRELDVFIKYIEEIVRHMIVNAPVKRILEMPGKTPSEIIAAKEDKVEVNPEILIKNEEEK